MMRGLVATLGCVHKCHTQGLNPWIEECPVCGCSNTDYRPDNLTAEEQERLAMIQAMMSEAL